MHVCMRVGPVAKAVGYLGDGHRGTQAAANLLSGVLDWLFMRRIRRNCRD
jgi:hypothetical protein